MGTMLWYSVILTLCLIFVASSAWVLYFSKKYGFWGEQYVQVPSAVRPWFGHAYRIFARKESLWNYCRRLYLKAASKKLTAYGFYFASRPALMVRDKTLVRQITKSHTELFDIFEPPQDRLLSLCPLFLKVDTRNQIFERDRLCAVVDRVVDCLLLTFTVEIGNEIDQNPNRMLEVNLLEKLSRVAGTIMTVVAFGNNLFVDNNNDPIDCELLVGKIFEEPKVTRKQILSDLIGPKSSKIFRSNIVPVTLERTFMDALSHYRNPNNRRNIDCMIDWLEEDAAMHERHLTDDEIGDYIFGFFVEVYISIVVIGSFVLLNFAHQPDVQTVARRKHPKYEFTKESLVDYEGRLPMDFLDATIAETMRLYPVTNLITRNCTTDMVQLLDSNSKRLSLPADAMLCISPYGFHTDPQNWKHPYRFFPDRFISQHRRSTICCYFPFEGMDWSNSSVFNRPILKCFLVMFLNRYDIKPSSRTPHYPKLKNNAIITTPEDGVYVELHPRVGADLGIELDEELNRIVR